MMMDYRKELANTFTQIDLDFLEIISFQLNWNVISSNIFDGFVNCHYLHDNIVHRNYNFHVIMTILLKKTLINSI